jgi:imidazoleglycerol phosphate synthase glutamine amidotransferase subunit HisH
MSKRHRPRLRRATCAASRAVEHAGKWPTSSDPRADDAAAVVCPVAARPDTMRNLQEHGFVGCCASTSRTAIFRARMATAPLDVSEEGGEHQCLGVVHGRVRKHLRRTAADGAQDPHMG